MKKNIIILLFSLILVLSAASFVSAHHEWVEGYQYEPYYSKSKDPLVVQYDEEHILDLTKNIVVARGESRIFSFGLKNQETIENKALENTQKAMFDAVGGLRLSANERLSGLLAKQPELAASLKKFINSTSYVMHCRIFTMRGTLRVTSSIKYSGPGGILPLVYPYLTAEASTNEVELAPGTFVPSSEPVIKGDYTGLIIDARGLKLEPSIAPTVLDQAKRRVYGKIYGLDADILAKGDIVDYASSLNSALKSARIGKNPLLIKALSAERNCDPIVSNEDGYKIMKENEGGKFFEDLRVIFII